MPLLPDDPPAPRDPLLDAIWRAEAELARVELAALGKPRPSTDVAQAAAAVLAARSAWRRAQSRHARYEVAA